jgi:hypothetical protein
MWVYNSTELLECILHKLSVRFLELETLFVLFATLQMTVKEI